MSQPYFDSRSLLALGIPKHTVEALQETYTRTGGPSDVALTLTDIEVLVTSALDQSRVAAQLRTRVNELEEQLAAVPSYTRKISELTRRIDDLENSLIALQSVSAKITQLQAMVNDLSVRVDNIPKTNLSEIYNRLDVLEVQI